MRYAEGGLFLSFVIGIDPEGPLSSPRSLRDLDQGQILKLNLFRLSKPSVRGFTPHKLLPSWGYLGQAHFPELQWTCSQVDGSAQAASFLGH